jgi:hypothetical protein
MTVSLVGASLACAAPALKALENILQGAQGVSKSAGAASAAKAPRAVDARNFDIAGIKTGMDWEQARAAMARHFQVAPDKFKKNSNLHYEKNGVKLMVLFTKRVPVDAARPLAVSLIQYEVPWTDANNTAMKEAALTKYGAPTEESGYLLWCVKPHPNTGGCSGAQMDGEAVLHLHSNTLQLSARAWDRALREYEEKAKTTRPGF